MNSAWKPKILYVCNTNPWPPVAGYKQRIFNIGKLLQGCGEVTLTIITKLPLEKGSLEGIEKHFGRVEVFRAFNESGRNITAKIRRLFDKHWIEGRDTSITEQQRGEFLQLAKEHDLVWFHTLKTADSTGIYSLPNSIVDLDDILSEKLKMESKFVRGFKGKIRQRWRSLLRHKWERDVTNRFTATCVCSDNDRRHFNSDNNVFVIPNGFERPVQEPVINSGKDPVLGFIGILRYYPNEDGACWFIKEVLPRVVSSVPDVCFRVVGLLPNTGSFDKHPNVEFLGYVDNSFGEVATWKAMIVPLRIGGGTRIKILDAFSKKCPVVSTSLGAYGLSGEHGRHLLLADSAQDFADACIRLLQDSKKRQELAKAGWKLFVNKYTWNHMAPKVENVVRFCLSK